MTSTPEDQDAPAVDVVLLTLVAGQLKPVGSDIAVDLESTSEPAEVTTTALDHASVTLLAEDDIPHDLLDQLIATSVPPLFRISPSLLDHRALVFVDDRCAVGDHVLSYDHTRGVELVESSDHLTEPPEPSFDLFTRPWIPVMFVDGATGLVSLTDLFTRSRTIRRITGETPPMSAALYRMVLALLCRVYRPGSETEWVALWKSATFPREPLTSYLHLFGDRFDLFHQVRPFFQCTELEALRPATVAKLVPYRAVGNNVTLFDHTTVDDRMTLSAAEAARWLITAQAFDPGGMKTPFTKEKSSERAHCNNFGVVLVEGADLHETLLLNTLIYQPDHEKPRSTTSDDRPVWEQAEPPRGEPGKGSARGWTQLLTWPSRRVLLVRDDNVVTGVVLTPGDRLAIDPPDEEKMAAFRRPRDSKGKIDRSAPLLAVRLHPLRGIWRHSVELLMKDLWEEANQQRAPALDQIDHFTGREHIPRNAVYTLRVFGQHLDKKASVVESWQEEEVPAPVPLLRARDDRVGGLIGQTIALTDEVGSALRALQANFRRDLRAKPHADIDIGYWPRLSRPFSTLLRTIGTCLDEEKSELDAARAWGKTVIQLGEDTAARWVRSSPLESAKLLVLGRHHAQFVNRLATTRKTYHVEIIRYCLPKDDDD